jgi:hypothetical protein
MAGRHGPFATCRYTVTYSNLPLAAHFPRDSRLTMPETFSPEGFLKQARPVQIVQLVPCQLNGALAAGRARSSLHATGADYCEPYAQLRFE